MNQPRISVIVPLKNEARSLPRTIPLILGFLETHYNDFEVILVDDGSTDSSSRIIQPFLRDARLHLLTHATNQGKGAAVRTGVLAAKGDFILFTDADLSVSIEETSRFLAAMEQENCDMVIASRAQPGSRIMKSQSWARVIVGKSGNLLIRMILRLPFMDTQCGFKLFKAAAARHLFTTQRFPRWSFDIEVLHKAAVAGMRVRELPVSWTHVEGSNVHPLMDPLKVLADVIAIRIQRRR